MRSRARLAHALVLPILLGAQAGWGFDLAAYQAHLDSTRSLTAEGLIASRQPYGPYLFRIPDISTAPEYLDSLTTLFSLTSGEQELLRRHGFVVSERLRYPSWGEAFQAIWQADMPVFVSSDAILHAVHRSYVDILAKVEGGWLRVLLSRALDDMQEDWSSLNAIYGSNPGMRASLDDVDVYLTVARSLLSGQTLASSGGNDAAVAQILQLAAALQPASYPLFNAVPRLYDFSQLKPRGHYTQSQNLRTYFKAMMWLGRTELRLTPPPGIPPTPDVTREIVDACLLRELADATQGTANFEAMDILIRNLVGAPDNVTLPELRRLAATLGVVRADELLDPGVMARFRAEIASGGYTAQAINSQILLSSPMHPEDLDPPYAFLLLGQRFILDSYVAWNVVFDRIEYQGRHPFRGLPSPLDILYALGNDDVLPLLRGELAQYHYAPNASALRYLIDGYEPEYWRQSLYTVWLQAIRSLSKSGREPRVPDFMKTGAWQQEKMNTQLGSWTELRHDNLLYAKQSYSGGSTCSFPRTYVEPVPELYRVLQAFAVDASAAFGQVGGSDPEAQRIAPFFTDMATILGRLATIAAKELDGAPFTPEENTFLGEVLYFGNGCGPYETGWYRNLYFSGSDTPTSEPDLLIADVHTQPTDEDGAPVGNVLHAATGRPEMGIFVAAPPGWPRTAFAGPVVAYHEHVTMGFLRLSDEEWQQIYEQGPPSRPDWTHVYLADAQGDVRLTGRRLVSDSTSTLPPAPPLVARMQLAQNVPNPFNPSTRISFRLDFEWPVAVHLGVYDGGGRLVRQLVRATLPSGPYHAIWDGTDRFGHPVGSGVYWARLVAGGESLARKLVLVR